MDIERIPEWALGLADDREIAGLLARCFDTDFGVRSYFQTRQPLHLVHRGGPIVAHMALQFRAMRLGDRLIIIAGLADVATAPEWRGQGLAGQMLQAAIVEARTSMADFLLLFGTEHFYAATGLRTVHNPMIWVERRGAVTKDICREPAESLMVPPLRDVEWDETATLELLGNLF